MKKIILGGIFGFLALVSLSSCSTETCYECTNLGATTEVCEDDYETAAKQAGFDNLTFDEYIDLLKDLGTDCKEK